MKTFLGIVILICALGLMAGCHSGTTRGIGSDISKLGNNMQK
ncbi:MAG: entericidin [Candidatus Omnitrophota bacterium]|jgi:predicted small secreted protein